MEESSIAGQIAHAVLITGTVLMSPSEKITDTADQNIL